jgi:hypothetical protein
VLCSKTSGPVPLSPEANAVHSATDAMRSALCAWRPSGDRVAVSATAITSCPDRSAAIGFAHQARGQAGDFIEAARPRLFGRLAHARRWRHAQHGHDANGRPLCVMVAGKAREVRVERHALQPKTCARIAHDIAQRAHIMLGSAATALATHRFKQPAQARAAYEALVSTIVQAARARSRRRPWRVSPGAW